MKLPGRIARSAGKDETGGGANKFWEDALHHMNTNLVDLPVFAGLQVSLPLMRSIVNSAPQNLAQIADPRWQESSAVRAKLWSRRTRPRPKRRRRCPLRFRGMQAILVAGVSPSCPRKPAASSPCRFRCWFVRSLRGPYGSCFPRTRTSNRRTLSTGRLSSWIFPCRISGWRERLPALLGNTASKSPS